VIRPTVNIASSTKPGAHGTSGTLGFGAAAGAQTGFGAAGAGAVCVGAAPTLLPETVSV
jgi:hypothetical protein